MLLKKRGYFFILDAMLALTVLVMGIATILSAYVKVNPAAQAGLLSDDLLNFLSNNRIKDLNSPYAGIGGELWNQGSITDADNTLLQQAGIFYATGQPDTAENFIQNVSAGIIPSQFDYEVWINGAVLYPKSPSPEHARSKNSTKLMLTSKKITFGILNRTTSGLWGPYKAEVFVWER